jgi:penicillin-binding protein 1B
VIGADGKALKAFPLEVTQLASPENVYQLDRMLVSVMDHGTGRPARAILPADLVVAGKSGTSSDYRDSWFAGFSGSHMVVVWVGYDDDEPTGFTGSAGALPVWAHVMANLGTRSWDTAMPESLAEVHLEFTTGLRAVPGCAEDLVAVAVPVGTVLPAKPGCGFPESPGAATSVGVLGELKEKAEHLLQDLAH